MFNVFALFDENRIQNIPNVNYFIVLLNYSSVLFITTLVL